MNITVNGMTVDKPQKDAANLEEMLVTLSENSMPKNHLVGVVKVNGEEFSERYERQARDVTLDTINHIDITTVSLEQFSQAAIQDTTVLLGHIEASVIKTAELFRLSEESEANEHYAQFIETLRDLFKFIDMTRKVTNWDFGQSLYNAKPVEDEWERLQELVNELKTTQEESDWILLADLLEYEVSPAMKRWQEIFREKAAQQN